MNLIDIAVKNKYSNLVRYRHLSQALIGGEGEIKGDYYLKIGQGLFFQQLFGVITGKPFRQRRRGFLQSVALSKGISRLHEVDQISLKFLFKFYIEYIRLRVIYILFLYFIR